MLITVDIYFLYNPIRTPVFFWEWGVARSNEPKRVRFHVHIAYVLKLTKCLRASSEYVQVYEHVYVYV